MARYEVPEGYTIALIATMPRSGTWYSFYFLEFLDLYLTGRTRVNSRMDLEIYHGLKLAKVHQHSICPGFLETVGGAAREAWDRLAFYGPAYNYGYDRFIRGNEPVFSPVQNPDIRIVYLYRNPLDQCLSFYRHIRRHRQRSARTYLDTQGQERSFRDAAHFLRTAGAEAYVKQYYSFHAMKRRFADQIFMLPYERLVGDPARHFEQLLGFLGVAIDDPLKRGCFAKALISSNRRSLKALESAIGGSLARDQSDPDESHLRSGKTGGWRRAFGPEEIAIFEQRLRPFGLSLRDFEFG